MIVHSVGFQWTLPEIIANVPLQPHDRGGKNDPAAANTGPVLRRIACATKLQMSLFLLR